MKKIEEIKEIIKDGKPSEDQPILVGVSLSIQSNGARLAGLYHFWTFLGYLTSMRVGTAREQADGTTDLVLRCHNR